MLLRELITILEASKEPTVNDLDWDTFDEIQSLKPSEVVDTGLAASEGATELQIFYHGGHTIVVPGGESQNSDPYFYKMRVSPADVKKFYLATLE